MTDTDKTENFENDALRGTERAALEAAIGYKFKKTKYLATALTHSSTGAEKNYERLEFLGDRVLALAIAGTLFKTFPEESEGDLAKRHAALVQGETIAIRARHLNLGEIMKFSAAERGAGGADNDNILADGLEAVLGALYLDAGFEKTAAIIRDLWGETIHNVKEPPQDPKTTLQEWAQARGLPLPDYEIIDREGPDHAPVFTVEVRVDGYEPVAAQGASRRAAEKAAAAALYSKLSSKRS